MVPGSLSLVVTASTVLARHVKPQTTVMPNCTCMPKDSVAVLLSTLPRPPL